MAIGGTRFWMYSTDEDALMDALRLSRGMTYKCAMANLPFGGGKSVILKSEDIQNRESLFRAHGKMVNQLGGRYLTAEDVGTTTEDMDFVRKETIYVAGLTNASGDPSPWTAKGVFRAMQAAAKYCFGKEDLKGRTVAIQGCGQVGTVLAKLLFDAGVKLVLTDTDGLKARRAAHATNGKIEKPLAIFDCDVDIFAPCALGGILNDETIERLRCEIVVGAANNQLQNSVSGDQLKNKSILYVPDYVANAGGVINGCREMLNWRVEQVNSKIDEIYEVTMDVLGRAQSDNVAPFQAADKIVEERLSSV